MTSFPLPIVAAGMSPAWQRVMRFESLAVGQVNRAVEVLEFASGKVLNVGRAVRALGRDVMTVSPLGGTTGAAIRREFERDGIAARFVETSGPTRTCITLLDHATGRTTELVENAVSLTGTDWANYSSTLNEAAAQAGVLVFSGSVPPVDGRSPAPEAVHELLAAAIAVPSRQSPAAALILDLRGPELLACLKLRPLLVKPNREELAATVRRELTTDQDLLQALRELIAGGAEWVLVTDGPGPAWLASREQCFRLPPPQLTAAEVVNPIGSGDCCTAGIAAGIAVGASIPQAVQLGMAAAVENVRTLLPARFERARLDEQSGLIHCEQRLGNA